MQGISGPCRICGIVMHSETGLEGLLCGPACRVLYAQRRAARETARPGDWSYHPENAVQRTAHRRALSSKIYGRGTI